MSGERTGGAKRRGTVNKTENRRAIRDEREAVLLALLSHERDRTFSNVLVKRTLDDCVKMSASERAFVKRLLEGVIERRMELDARIEQLTKRSVNRLHPAVRQVLRMGIYQICYMDAVPDSAACNESVRLAKKHAPARLSGFVNGVLRNAVREEEKARAAEGTASHADEEGHSGSGQGESSAGKKVSFGTEGDDWVKTASRRFSSPEWLVEMWEQELGREEAEHLLGAFMEVFAVSARIRCMDSLDFQSDREKVILRLRAAGVEVENGKWLPDSLRLRKTSNLRRLPGFSNGLWTVQDESSMLAVEAAGLKGSETVYDVCAAPGGKSFLAADMLRARCAQSGISEVPAGNGAPGKTACEDEKPAGGVSAGNGVCGKLAHEVEKPAAEVSAGNGASGKTACEDEKPAAKELGTVFSFDLSRKKTDKIREGAERLHISNMIVGERDARVFFPEDEGKADVVFCDLPCSGLGVIGKKRDIKYRASLEGIVSLQGLQREILANSVRYLKSGGVLIYSTCTVSRRENEENAAWIESELGLVPDDLSPVLPDGIPGIRGNMLQLLPHVHGTDGFFVARFLKK